MDDVKMLLLDHGGQGADAAAHAGIQNERINAHGRRIVRKRASCKADQPHLLRPAQTFQQRQNVRLGASDIAAGN